MSQEKRAKNYKYWKKAIERSMDWLDKEDE